MKICNSGPVRVLRGRSLRAVQIGSVIAKHEQGRGQTVEVHSTTIRTPPDQASVIVNWCTDGQLWLVVKVAPLRCRGSLRRGQTES